MSKRVEITPFFDNETNTAQYIVADVISKKCAVVDTVMEFATNSGKISYNWANQMLNHIKSKDYDIEWILETHCHADHLTASAYFKDKFPKSRIGISERISEVQKTFFPMFSIERKPDGTPFDALFKDGHKFKIGELDVEVTHCPGHTPADACFLIKDGEEGHLFVGDTVFMPDGGTARCDFPNGSAKNLWNSIHKIFSFPPSTKIYCCHDYGPGGRAFAWVTTVEEERKNNIHVKEGTTEEQFLDFRTKRDATLTSPKLILPALQVNLLAGQLPSPKGNGIAYFLYPLNQFDK